MISSMAATNTSSNILENASVYIQKIIGYKKSHHRDYESGDLSEELADVMELQEEIMRDYISNVVMTAIKEYADSLELEFCVETLGDKPIVSLFVSSPDYDEGKHFHLVDIPDELLGEDYVEDRISIKKITKFKKAWNTFLKTVEGDSNGTGA